MATKKPVVESAAPASDKKKALETAMAQIERAYGKGSIMRLGENVDVMVESIPTGSLSLDLALGIGGMPRGRIIEIYGPESSGKTTLALHVVAEAQKRGGEVAFIDAATPVRHPGKITLKFSIKEVSNSSESLTGSSSAKMSLAKL